MKRILLALLLVSLTAVQAQVHDVPARKQDKPDNCGPTAVTSCLGWFRNHGYDLRTRDGKSGLDDLQKQIDQDSSSSDRNANDHERTVDELGHGLQRLLKGGPYEKRLRPGKPQEPGDLKNFGYLDREFSHGEDIILLIRFGNNQGHFVTVRNITPNGSGGRTIEYMDPADGQTHTMDVDVQGGKLRLNYNGQKGYIENALTLSPVNVTESTTPQPVDPSDPGKGKKVTYHPYFPEYAKARDLHILVTDCDRSHYIVNGLPQGWSVSITRSNGKCFLTINRGNATADLSSGDGIEVIYKGQKKFVQRSNGVVQTSDGGTTMASPLSNDPGQVIADRQVRLPGEAIELSCSIGETAGPESFAVHLQWTPVAGASGYVVRESYTGAEVGRSASPEITLNLPPDVLHSLSIAAQADDPDVEGPASEPVVIYRDVAFSEPFSSSPATLEYVDPLTSWHRPYSWKLSIPGGEQDGHLIVTIVSGAADPPLPADAGTPQPRWYHFSADARLRPGNVEIEIPYGGDAHNPRLYLFAQGRWTDVTDHVDSERHMISGKLPQLGPVVILGASGSRILQISYLWIAALLAILVLLWLIMRRRR